ncbi:MAG: YihY/virulence factor BrkB family protein [Prevotella sp.]|nr:YihY/virulence factor BrkB family protein [Bacteroides sp.]MCM1365953.1 YihY/virulence factor BrkB family protein [Prevotella sp.]MCM1436626.1 YihY/virulence factor BrkB family protein [Prevotella sp.]
MSPLKKNTSFFTRLFDKATAIWEYCSNGVWSSPKNTLSVRLIKTLNLSVRAFLDRDLQSKSMSLTYSTVLAIVPAFALLVAIGRGFGLQNLITQELYIYFPSQSEAIETALGFVDRYLNQATQGVFVGVGIIVLLWTLISLLSSIEESFNFIWDIKRTRAFFQQITDYIAICLIIPLLMLCSSGVSIFMSAIAQDGPGAQFITPIVNISLELSPIFLVWLAFALSFYLIPNTKVDFKYAAISGLLCAIAFNILQLLFVNGQIYVSKYNAIYGSFAFLPLLLIWLQLSWLILLFGCVLTYSLQNVFAYNFLGDLNNVSYSYMQRVVLVLTAIIVKRFDKGLKPLSPNDISMEYDLPIRLINRMANKLYKSGIIYFVYGEKQSIGMTPAKNIDTLTVADVLRSIDDEGEKNFIPNFDKIYSNIISTTSKLIDKSYSVADNILIKDLQIPSVSQINKITTPAPSK